jgi:hypothetical protein
MNWFVRYDLHGRKLSVVAPTVFLSCLALYAQPAPSHTLTSHVKGTIRGFANWPIAGVEVKFEGEKTAKSVSSDANGYYETELPAGVYAMSVSWGAKERYRRPQFIISASQIIILDINLQPDDASCDPLVREIVHADGTRISREPTQDDFKDACGGRDYFPIPSEQMLTLDLLIQYSNRQRSGGKNTYYDAQGAVLVAYNLFTLTADKVVYDAENRTISAAGGVVAEDGLGSTRHADSICFKLGDGEAVPLN